MKRPESLVVGPFTYSVGWDEKLGSMGASGLTNSDNQMISIDPNLAGQNQRATLVHEVLHALWKQTPLKVSFPDGDSDSVGESIIQTLEPLLYSFIRDNKEVIRWLQSQ